MPPRSTDGELGPPTDGRETQHGASISQLSWMSALVAFEAVEASHLLFDCRTDLAQQGVKADSPVLHRTKEDRMLFCSHTPLRRFDPEPHIPANPQSHRDPHPRLNERTRLAGLYVVDVSSASSAHVIRARSRQGIAHSDGVLIAA
jgi:hypothetical protein